jgi:tetratricopeptide (TPR) repeat protein
MKEVASQDALRRFDDLWDFDDPGGTETKFRELLPRAEEVEDRSLVLQIRTQLARTLGLQKKWEEAQAELDAVERELPEVPDVVRVRYLLERGRVFRSSGHPDRARLLFEEAWELARPAGEDGFAVDAAHMMAIVETGDSVIQWNETALDLARTSTEERARKWRASLLNNLGWTYHERGNFPKALALFEEALEEREARGQADEARIAKWCVARAKRSLGRTEEALAEQRELLRKIEEDGRRDGFVFEEIAECLWRLGREEEARPFFAQAWTELAADPWLPDSEPERLARLRELGRV